MFLKRFNSRFQLFIIVFHSSFHNVMQSPKIPELSVLVFLYFLSLKLKLKNQFQSTYL